MSDRFTDIKKGKKDSISDFIHCQFRSHRDRMTETFRIWMLNLAWIRGFQNVDFDTRTRKFQTFNRKEPWRVRLMSNLMIPIIRRNVAALTYIKPIWDVIPATADETDLEIAEKSTKVLIDTWQRVGMNKKLLRMLTWQESCGSAFLKVGWDHDLGKKIEIEKNLIENQVLEEYLAYMGIEIAPEIIEANAGDIYTDVVPPFNITVDENDSVLEDSLWIIETQLRSKDYVVNKWGKKFENVKETNDIELYVYPYVQSYNERASSLPRKGVLVHELFIKHCQKFPNGLHCILVDDTFAVTPKDNPYSHGELPYAHFVSIYDPASFWGTCVAEQVRSNQAKYNRISSSVMENVNLMTSQQWIKPKQAGNITFTNRPGGVIEFNYPFEPKPVQHTSLPGYVERTMDRTRMDIQDTASSHDVTEGKAEPGIRSGTAIKSLQEADDNVLNPTLMWMDEGLSHLGRLTLQTIYQFTDNARLVEIEGQFNEPEIFSFTGEDLKGKAEDGNYFKVRVKTYGRQILSRSGRENLATSLIQMGILNPQMHREQILQILGTADIVGMYDQGAMDRTRQWREIKLIIEGQQVQVYTGQNHIIHIEACKKFIASSMWDRLKEEQKQAVIEHLAMHMKQQVNEALFPQIYAAQLGAGDPNGGRTESNRSSRNGTQARAGTRS